MTATPPVLVPLAKQPGNHAAIVFVHGFQGHPEQTWGEFPRLVAEGTDGRLTGWDMHSLGYATSLSLDIRGIWRADPEIAILGTLLRTAAANAELKKYNSLALVAHSMGGLVVQRALVEDAGLGSGSDLANRVGHVFLFGTPSAGLEKAAFAWFWKKQIEDMVAGSVFIKNLRAGWSARFASPRFTFWTVAGASDDFVPWTSSVGPFPEPVRAVIPGDHLEIVKPADARHLGVQIVRKGLLGDASPAGPWNAARVAVQQREFQKAVDLLWPNQSQIDDDALVQLSLALEEVGRRPDAIKALEERPSLSTDAMGVLAGRLKRRWLAERVEKDAAKALELYSRALELSEARSQHAQAYYHGINVAFLQVVYRQDRPAAQAQALRVLDHSAQAPDDPWKEATQGEAHLILGKTEEAMDGYRRFVAEEPSPRELSSAYQQATILADRLKNKPAREQLAEIFRGPAEKGA
jgi:pimeloyl-ACP methyl ester carboxylesterase